MKASFLLLDRDDGVIIPGKVEDGDDWQEMEVELGDGLELKDIERSNVAMLQHRTEDKLRFITLKHDDFFMKFDAFEKDGWFPIGFEMVRFYTTFEEFLKAEEEA